MEYFDNYFYKDIFLFNKIKINMYIHVLCIYVHTMKYAYWWNSF